MKRILMLAAVLLAALTVMVGCSRDKDAQVEQAPQKTPESVKPAEKEPAPGKQRLAQADAVLPAAAGDEGPDVSTEAQRKALAEGNTEFALDLYRRLAAKSKGGNVVFSPYSISAALAMTYAGARGETAAEMAKALRFPFGQEQLHPAFAGLRRRLLQGGGKHGVEWRDANALWVQKGFGVGREFLDVLRTHHAAGAGFADFKKDHEGARLAINEWAGERTKGKIRDALPSGVVTPRTRLVLANACYFHAGWADPFREVGTRPEAFWVTKDRKATSPMMRHNRLETGYAELESHHAVQLRYRGDCAEMLLLIPKQVEGLADVERSLTVAGLAKARQKLRRHYVDLSLPRFRLEANVELGAELETMGMKTLFKPDANLTGINPREPLLLERVLHSARLDTTERGTEAAAVTTVIGSVPLSTVDHTPKVKVRCDRPFILLIFETRTSSVLFLGRVTNPAEGG